MDQIIYILINESMPGYVKIGKTSDLEQRVRDLSRASGVPLPFEVFYAATVADMHTAERLLHDAFADSRVVPNREFFRVAPERVVAALKLAQVVEVTPGHDIVESAEEQVALDKARKNRGRFNFKLAEVPVGSTLTFTRDRDIQARVVSDTKVDYEGEVLSLSEAARRVLSGMGIEWKAVQGPAYWEYNDEILDERRLRLEGEE